MGKVKIIFVDVPFSRITPIYARYYLYAVKAVINDEEVFRVRKILFKAAQEKHIETKEALASHLQEEKIAWKEFDEKPILQRWSYLIKHHDVNRTPTLVIKYSSTDVKKYVNAEEIWSGLTELKSQLKTKK